MFCCTLLYVHFSIAIILMGKRELIALLNLSSWCLVMVERLFLTVPRGCLQFVIVVFPDHTHLLFIKSSCQANAGAQALFFIFIRIFFRKTPILALKISKIGVSVYFGTPCFGYALNCLFVYLVIPGTRPLFKRKQKFFIILFTCNLEK